MNTKIRTRFAPSPTGFVHIGSLRTALFSFLFARHNNGAHILRVEDTDQSRKVEGALENLLRVMKTVGVEFDEGFYLIDDGGVGLPTDLSPEVLTKGEASAKVGERGEFAPYLQSKRLALYQKHAKELVEKGHAYYCFCSKERLDELHKEQIALKKPSMYDRLCRNLSDDEVKDKLAEFSLANKNPVIRQAIPLEGETVIHDLIYGEITYEHKILDDQVILKSDGFPTYHLAVVVDDHYMKITHVIRGEEWIPSTPKHLLLYKFFGWEPTEFAHLPLILNPDKSKLSKRQGDVAIEDFLKHGYLPEALINFVAFLGWNPKNEKEIFSMDELIADFDLAKVNKAGAVFDDNKLDWFNSQYIKKMSPDELAEKLKPFWQQANIDAKNYSNAYLAAIAELEQERLKKLSEIGERTGYFFKTTDYGPDLLVWKKSDKAKTKAVLSNLFGLLDKFNETDFKKESLETKIKKFIVEKKYDNGSALWPLRVALTGLTSSPGPFEVASVLALGLGKKEVLERIKAALAKLD